MKKSFITALLIAASSASWANTAPTTVFTGRSPNPDAKKVSATGNFSKPYGSEEEAKLNAPNPPIDKVCGQNLYAAVFDQTFECKQEHGKFLCKQTQQADCLAR